MPLLNRKNDVYYFITQKNEKYFWKKKKTTTTMWAYVIHIRNTQSIIEKKNGKNADR